VVQIPSEQSTNRYPALAPSIGRSRPTLTGGAIAVFSPLKALRGTVQSRIAGKARPRGSSLAAEQHHEAVYPQADAAGRRHSLLQRLHEHSS